MTSAPMNPAPAARSMARTVPLPAEALDKAIRQGYLPNGNFSGRRLRAFLRLIRATDIPREVIFEGQSFPIQTDRPFPWPTHAKPTYRQYYTWVNGPDAPDSVRELLSWLCVHRNPQSANGNAELTPVLQDLGDQIISDIREACAALDDPDVWYPGVDEGIEPVTDSHVQRVIAGLQRELNRELRTPDGGTMQNAIVPAVPLSELPWRVQRALVERRRLRFKQWGIGLSQWVNNHFSLWDIPEDSLWLPSQLYYIN